MKYRIEPAGLFRCVDIFTQVLVKAAKPHGGMFPSVCERHIGQMLMDWPLPAPIPGQRNSDRCPRGANLQHDIPILQTLDGLALSLGRPHYQKLREDYLKTFALECAPISPTGLLPWGEHSYWNLHLHTIGNSYLMQYAERAIDAGLPTHQQLYTLPIKDWAFMHQHNPDLLPRFVEGLDWHWMNEERTAFNRHAPITQLIPAYQVKRQNHMLGEPFDPENVSGSDFPNVSGLMIHDYACAMALVEDPDPKWERELLRFIDYWWDKRVDCGACPKSSNIGSGASGGPCLKQTTGLANSLFQTAEVLAEKYPDLSATIKDQAISYTNACLSLDQPLLQEKGQLVLRFEEGKPFNTTSTWSGLRSDPTTASFMINLLNNAIDSDDERGLELAILVGEKYLDDFIPKDQVVRAGDPGSVIGLMAELYRLTGDQKWLEAGMMHAGDAMELYFDSPMPRAALGRSHYESQLGSSVLVHSMARLYLIGEGIELRGGLERATGLII